MSKPELIDWCENTSTNTDFIHTPSDPFPTALKESGYVSGQKPSRKEHNYLFRNQFLWAQYLSSLSKKYSRIFTSTGSTASFSSTDLTLASNLDFYIEKDSGGFHINRLPSGSYTISSGQVFVFKPDLVSSSPVTLTAGTYGSLDAGEYAIINSSSLAGGDYENEVVWLYRLSNTLHCLLNNASWDYNVTTGNASIIFERPHSSIHNKETTVYAFNSTVRLRAASGETGAVGYVGRLQARESVDRSTSPAEATFTRQCSSLNTQTGVRDASFFSKPTAGAVDDVPYVHYFSTMNGSSSEVEIARMQFRMNDVTAGTENARFELYLRKSGAVGRHFIFDGTRGLLLPSNPLPTSSAGNYACHESVAKAWGVIDTDGTTFSLTDSFNISSISTISTTTLEVFIGNDFTSSNYCVVTGFYDSVGISDMVVYDLDSFSFKLKASGASTNHKLYFACFGYTVG